MKRHGANVVTRKQRPSIGRQLWNRTSLSADAMIPADLRLLEAKDLFINQSALTGEAMPAKKFAAPCADAGDDPFDLPNI